MGETATARPYRQDDIDAVGWTMATAASLVGIGLTAITAWWWALLAPAGYAIAAVRAWHRAAASGPHEVPDA